MSNLVSLAAPPPNPSSFTDDDAELIRGIRAQNPQALDALMIKYEADVYRMISKLVSNRADVEELAQATFLAMWRTGDRYRGEASVRTFLLSLAYNLVRNHWRSQRRRRLALLELFRTRDLAGPEEAASPELTTESRRKLKRALEAIRDLPEPMREALVLCELESLSQAEVSAALGVPPATLRTRLYQARKRLSKAVEAKA